MVTTATTTPTGPRAAQAFRHSRSASKKQAKKPDNVTRNECREPSTQRLRKSIWQPKPGKFDKKKLGAGGEVRRDPPEAQGREELRRAGEAPAESAPTRSHQRCELTGRRRGYYRKFKISRIMLRELALAGKIPGLRKASW